MTFGISAFGAVFAETTVTEKGELCFADLLTRKNPRQDQIQDCDPMVETAEGKFTFEQALDVVKNVS